MNYNERDIEHPSLISFIKSHPDIVTMLDVGAFYSHYTYAGEVRKLIDRYVGIDIDPDPETAKILDHYIVGDVKKHTGKYDLVACVSTIEHSGISSYKRQDYQKEQRAVFKKLVELTGKYLFVTFPYGTSGHHADEFANIDKEQLAKFREMVKGKIKTRFYYSPAPQIQYAFEEVDEDEAGNVEYIQKLGTRCVCIMEVDV